ncbi:MAG: hypothetical protein J7M13_07140 [Synergistetes bacterium]|nr:hypothetical protein [Synergistota bacterium]
MSKIVFLIFILSAIMTLQFFKGRKINLLLMKNYLGEIEAPLKIRDKEYTWIGGYVGFKAGYKIQNPLFSFFEVSLILAPRQSLIYLPLSLLLFRGDRAFFLLTPRGKRISRELHLIRDEAFLFKPKIRRKKELFEKRASICGVNFRILYEDEKAVEDILKLFKRYKGNIKIIKHLALVPSTNRVYLHLKPMVGELKRFLTFLIEKMELY